MLQLPRLSHQASQVCNPLLAIPATILPLAR